ncbi:MAG: HEAT repeat domain-containing protein [Planctomycetes bacterium]|nr:HEAT repeat domain-containing protein [Planctomycetota bacterium]
MSARPLYVTALLAALVFAVPAQEEGPSIADLVEHYRRVEGELRAARTAHLTPEQLAARLRVVDLLRAYRERAEFGETRPGDAVRVPYFIDDGGRRCAVANLLDQTGQGAVSLRVAATANGAWVCELAEDLDLQAWLRAHGLTMAEAARIQAPGNSSRWERRRRQQQTEQPEARPAPVPVYAGPTDVHRPSADRLRSRGTGAGAAPAPAGSAGLRVGARAGGTAARRPGGMPVTGDELPADWSAWWEFARGSVLPVAAPRPVHLAAGTAAGDAALFLLRGEVAAVLERALADGDAAVRAEAARAFARVTGPFAYERLVPLLADPNLAVRHAAVLALGETGSARAAHVLQHLAVYGRVPREVAALSAMVRTYALLGLATMRARVDAPGLDRLVNTLVARAGGAREPDLAHGALLYHALTGGAAGPEIGQPLASAEHEPEFRTLALAVLGRSPERGELVTLMRALSGRDLEARRAAALALARTPSDLAAPALTTACELEKEQVTRGFLLLALGQRGEAASRDFLLEMLARGPKALRPFAALAVGQHVRVRQDPELAAALRVALATNHNHAATGAFLIALGAARDPRGLTNLLVSLRHGTSLEIRRAAADALALHGDPRALPVLRERIVAEPCPNVRAAIAQALAAHGEVEDIERVRTVLLASRDEDGAGQAAWVAGSLCDLAGVRALLAALEERGVAQRLRPYVVRALGVALARDGAARLAGLGAGVNVYALPAWLQNLILAE